ncbi:MAG TPA: ATP-binding protein [Anaerolineae bacterium]|nr:ATP-binding protein [Anaerolineae bacterium]HQI85286.1 ATP-binding protein [Anaerolineae bacterium]
MNENPWRTKWTQDQIRALLLEQFEMFRQMDTGIPRARLVNVEQAASLPHAVIISGLRRAGKSTLLAQMAHKLDQEHFYYLNFEDDRFLSFQAEDANAVYQTLVTLFGERKTFVVDEIQNIPGWEHFVRRFMDMGFKFYITGSNAALLSRELGSRLTGRYVPIELFPFSFAEFLQFRGYEIPDTVRMTTTDKGLLRRYLDEYLRLGGIPEPLKYPDLPLLRILYDDVLYRDIAVRYGIDEVGALKELAFYLVSNPAGLVSYNKLKQQLHLGSVNTVKNYIEYLENSWLVFTVNVYDYSVKRQQIAPKKVYCIDTGLANNVGFTFSPNTGKLLENLVFLALRRRTKEIYYYVTPSGYEVDFYLPETRQIFQVAQNIEHPPTCERELRALSDALRALNLSYGMILTDANMDPIEQEGATIEIRSLAEWLIEQ